MAQGYDADRESEQARRRLTEIAQELGRRSNPDYVKHEAQALFEEKKHQAQSYYDEHKDAWKAQVLEKKDEVTEKVKAQLLEKKDEVTAQVKDQVKTQLREKREEVKEKSREWAFQAKEAAVKTSKEYGERAVGSPTFLGILGGIAGALAGRALAKRRTGSVRTYDQGYDRAGDFAYGSDRMDFRTRDFSRTDAGMRWRDDGGAPYRTQGYADTPATGLGADLGTTQAGTYGTTGFDGGFSGYDSAASIDSNADFNADANADAGPDIKERLGGAKDAISSKASVAKDAFANRASHVADVARHGFDGARERMHQAYDRLPSRDAMRSEITDTYHRGLEEQPWGLVAGAIGIGLVAGIFLPMSDRERQLVAPLRDKAQDRIHNYREQAEGRLRGYREQAEQFVHTKLEGNADDQNASGTARPANDLVATNDLSTDVKPTDLTLSGDGIGDGSLNQMGTDAEVGSDVAEDRDDDNRGPVSTTYDPPTMH